MVPDPDDTTPPAQGVCGQLAGGAPAELGDNPLVRLWQSLSVEETELLDGMAALDAREAEAPGAAG